MDWDKIEESKKAERAHLATLPIGEKFRLLEAMRRRAEAIKNRKLLANNQEHDQGQLAPVDGSSSPASRRKHTRQAYP